MSAEPKIILMDANNVEPLRKWRATETVEFGLSIVATGLVAGTKYKIVTPGTTDFTLVGAANSTAGTIFTASGAGLGTGTVVQMIVRYNVKSGESSDILKFMVWNNRKTNAVIDLEIASGCAIAGDTSIELDGVNYVVTLAVNTDTDLVAAAIKDTLTLDSGFSAGWVATVIPAVKFDGVTVRNTILSFKSKDLLVKGIFKFTPNTTGVSAIMTEMLVGNPATDIVSKITDAKIYLRDETGGITSDVVTDKWAFIKNESDATFTNLGVDTNATTHLTTEYNLPLKAINSAAAIGEILGGVNTALLTDDSNFDKLNFYMRPPATGVAQGLRQWKLVITYNFT